MLIELFSMCAKRAVAHAILWSGVLIACVASPAKSMAEEFPPANEPTTAAASDQAEKAIAGFRVPTGFKVELVAAEPLLSNPVTFCIDEQGRIYVAETYRQTKGAEDNREHMDWLDDDLAAQTVEDRLAFFKKHLKDKIGNYAKEQDRVRLLQDNDGDGKMDSSTLFAGPFHDVLDGIGAGLLARGGNVWYTCIPKLWLLQDKDGDGKADVRQDLHHGYGVRVAFRGHDLHGLVFGPDGKLYYSVGDRGFNITTAGRTLAYPDRGAVFRCNPDGSELEIVALGLRNPQELAFDQYGNLFTGDNNSDSGDWARWVYIVEGGDSGWRMNYQYISDRGPWNREKLWHPQHEGQAAYLVPPLANLADGPAGLTYYPGVGLPERYDGHFFLADFRGGAANSGVHSLAVKPKGAGFDVTDQHQFFWSVLATDCTFGPDCNFYVLDWAESWQGVGKGRIYRLVEQDKAVDVVMAETQALLSGGMGKRSSEELVRLLEHADMRVRQAAQFALADKGAAAIELFASVARANEKQLARLHAIWGLGQIGRQSQGALKPVIDLLGDRDPEVRAQAAKVAGDERAEVAATKLIAMLGDENLRVRFFAAQSLGKLHQPAAIEPLLAMLRENDDQDVYLRHAGVMGLAGSGDTQTLLNYAADESPSARLGIALALRRLESPEIARFLQDASPKVADEAARAINDVPIDAAMPQLAAALARPGLSEVALARALNANLRLGEVEHARRVARFAARSDVLDAMRVQAMNTLLNWSKPSNRDAVMGSWRPLAERDAKIATEAVRGALPAILTSSDKVRQLGVQLAGRLGIREVGPVLYELAADKSRPADVRVEAIAALAQLKDRRQVETMDMALADADPVVRTAGRSLQAKLKPADALVGLEKALAEGALVEQQGALAALGEMQDTQADKLLLAWLDKLAGGAAPAELQLDLLEAAAKRSSGDIKDKLAAYEAARPKGDAAAAFHESLAGGDAARGRKIFLERAEVSCVRCHKVAGAGGEVGPDLSKIGAEKQRNYLLQAIVEPNKAIAKGFDSVLLVLDDGKVVSGILKSEDTAQIKLVTAEGKALTIDKQHVEERSNGKSPMPEDVIKKLSKADVRDLVEFLSSLKGT